LAVVTASAAISAARIVPSKIFAVVTASVAIVTTPAFVVQRLQIMPAAASPLMSPQIHFLFARYYGFNAVST
jgi:hypothetical protein